MLDLTKPVQLENGHKVKIYEVYKDRIHGAYFLPVAKSWNSCSWDLSGKVISRFCHFSYRLVNVPEKQSNLLWLVIYKNGSSSIFTTEEQAINASKYLGKIGADILPIYLEKEDGKWKVKDIPKE